MWFARTGGETLPYEGKEGNGLSRAADASFLRGPYKEIEQPIKIALQFAGLDKSFGSSKTPFSKGVLAGFKGRTLGYSSAMTSISTKTFLGRVLTATQERAGLPVKYFA